MSRAAFARSPRRLRATFPLALALCAAAACADSGGASAPDTAPPHVLATNPVDGAQGISATSAVSVSFSEDVAPASVTATSFVVIPQGGAAALSGTYVVTGSEVTFQPAESLAAGTTYVVRLTGEITDLAGNALGSVTEFSFATRTNGAPVASAGAAQDASWNAVVTLDGTSSTDPDGDPIAYEWTQTGGPAVTLADENTATPAFTAPSKVTTLTFTLRVTDSQNEIGVSSVVVRVWVDKTKAVFVSATTGDDGSAGSLEAPVKTIGRGISLASGRGPGAAVYVAGGTYTESLALTTGLGIYGGFSASSWTRLGSQTILAGGPTAVSMSSASGAILEGLDIRSASPTTGGASSVGVFVSNSTDVVIAGCTIGAANGAAGAAGAAGQAGAHGSIGSAGQPGNCSNQGGAAYAGEGGSGGALVWGGGGGGRGGYQVVCNDFGLNCIWSTAMGVSGWSAQGSGTGGGGGAGGAPGSDSGVSGQSGGAGQDGGNGTLGSPGPDYGWIGVTGYVAATVGGVGAFGKGGGGGGGGGGSFGRREGFLFTPGLAGNGGGGGGGGGEGGHGGLGGRGGGGSFGVLAYGSTVTVTGSSITTGNGGPGGGGGQGGGGGSGGNGGTGNTFCQLDIGSGGSGGRGGRGGAGGQGGGGSGGPSIGIAWDPSSTVTQTGSTIQAGSGGTPGAPNGLAGITAGTLQR